MTLAPPGRFGWGKTLCWDVGSLHVPTSAGSFLSDALALGTSSSLGKQFCSQLLPTSQNCRCLLQRGCCELSLLPGHLERNEEAESVEAGLENSTVNVQLLNHCCEETCVSSLAAIA